MLSLMKTCACSCYLISLSPLHVIILLSFFFVVVIAIKLHCYRSYTANEKSKSIWRKIRRYLCFSDQDNDDCDATCDKMLNTKNSIHLNFLRNFRFPRMHVSSIYWGGVEHTKLSHKPETVFVDWELKLIAKTFWGKLCGVCVCKALQNFPNEYSIDSLIFDSN